MEVEGTRDDLPKPGALEAHELEVLGLVAVAAGQADRALVLHSRPESEQLAAFQTVSSACESGVLIESHDRTWSFSDESVRAAIVERLGPAKRAALNLAVAQGFEGRDGGITEKNAKYLAHHYVGAVPLVSGEQAASYCLSAGKLLNDRDEHEAARKVVESGMELIGRSKISRLQADLLAELSRSMLATLEVWSQHETTGVMEAAMNAYAELGDIDAALEIAGRPLPALHGQDATVGFLERASSLAEERLEDSTLIKIRLARAYLLERADKKSAMVTVNSAIDQAIALGREDYRLRGLAARAFISVYALDAEAANADASYVLSRSTSDPERLAELDACESMVSVGMLNGDLDLVYSIGERMAAAGERTSNQLHTTLGEMVMGRSRLSAGDLNEAEYHLERTHRLQSKWPIPIVLLAYIAFQTGHKEAYERWLEMINQLELPASDPNRLAVGFSPTTVWAGMLLDLGQLTGDDDLVTRARLIIEPPKLGTGMPLQQMVAMEPAAKIAIIDNDTTTIARLDAEYGALFGGKPPWWVLDTVALLAVHSGDRTRGERILRYGIRYCEQRGMRLMTLGLSKTLLGLPGRSGNSPAKASVALARRAIDTANEIGVVAGLDTIHSVLQRSGRSRFGQGEQESLTDRERQVVECIARGMSNRQIAAELVISPYTVDSHVRNLLIKLGVATRAEAAQKWARLNGD